MGLLSPKAPYQVREAVKTLRDEILNSLLDEISISRNIYVEEIVEGAVKIRALEIYERSNDESKFREELFKQKQNILDNVRSLVIKCKEENHVPDRSEGLSGLSADNPSC
jgi:predicted HNH restriction endonuclease